MANQLGDARRSLIRAKESAKKRLVELEDEIREVKRSLKSLEAALKALARSNREKRTSGPATGEDGGRDDLMDGGPRDLPKTRR